MDVLAASGLNCELFRSAKAPGVNVAADSVCELSDLTASEAIRRIAAGELRTEEYVGRLLQRLRGLRALSPLTWIDEPQVLEAARAVDQRRIRGEPLGALGGLPVLVKNNIDVARTPMAAAARRFRDKVRAAHTPAVQRLLDQGAIVFGSASMHEPVGRAACNHPLTAALGNPYDPGRIAGGSIAGGAGVGTAAAIAARIVPAGLGSDTAGSVRISSALCGTAGLRPSTAGGELDDDCGVLPLARDLDTAGPMARTARDTALMHSAITRCPPARVPDLRQVRIGVPRTPYWEDIDAEVARVAEDALVRLRAAGATLIEVDPVSYYFLACEGLEALTARGELRRKIRASYRELLRLQGLTAVVFPTVPAVALPVKAHGGGPAEWIEINGRCVDAVQLIRNTRVTCALGAPGLSLPAGLTRRGLPVGLELDAAPGHDSELLALAMAVEQVLPRLPAPQESHGAR